MSPPSGHNIEITSFKRWCVDLTSWYWTTLNRRNFNAVCLLGTSLFYHSNLIWHACILWCSTDWVRELQCKKNNHFIVLENLNLWQKFGDWISLSFWISPNITLLQEVISEPDFYNDSLLIQKDFYGASGGLCFLIVEFPRYLHLYYWYQWNPLRNHAYSNILKIVPPQNENFQI